MSLPRVQLESVLHRNMCGMWPFFTHNSSYDPTFQRTDDYVRKERHHNPFSKVESHLTDDYMVSVVMMLVVKPPHWRFWVPCKISSISLTAVNFTSPGSHRTRSSLPERCTSRISEDFPMYELDWTRKGDIIMLNP